MAATVQIHEVTATNTGYDKTSATVRFKSVDETTFDTNNRVQIPGAGINYSYTKTLRFYVSVAPSVDIQNLRAYVTDTTALGQGITCQYTVIQTFAANTNANISGTDLVTKTAGSPIDLDALNAGPHTGTGYKGDNLRLQLAVTTTASNGALTPRQVTWSYDET